jgi:hypothetical protein
MAIATCRASPSVRRGGLALSSFSLTFAVADAGSSQILIF